MEISATDHRRAAFSLGSYYENTPNRLWLTLQKIFINFIKQSMIMVVLLFFSLSFATDSFSVEAITGEQERTNFNNIEKEMENHYKNGELEEVITLYESKCWEGEELGKEKKEFKKIPKRIKADIYRWAALSYFGLDQKEKGEICIKKLLILRRAEGIDSDWYSIRKIANEHYVWPRWMLGLKGGFNSTSVHLVKDYSGSIPLDGSEKDTFVKGYILSKSGGESGVVVEYALTKNFSLTLQPSIIEQYFTYKNSFAQTEGNITHLQSYTHKQKLINVEIPLLLKYRFLSKSSPNMLYLQIGMYCNTQYWNDEPVRTIIYEEDGEIENKVDIVTKKIFRNWGLGVWAGAGIALNFRGISLEYEMNYKFGINNITDEAMRFQNEELMFGYYDVLDDIKLRYWSISIKALLPLHFKVWKR